jgi:para-nitrobenzyl esterase
VFIHGGAFVDGAGSEYNGTHLAALNGAVIVTLNYRLGVLGFLQHTNGMANFGMSDQIAALHWIATHIGAFGGDSDRVTIFGESAGAISCINLLASPLARGLFRRVIAESGFPSGSRQSDSLALSEKFLNASGCTMADATERLACLQSLSYADVAAADKQVVPADSNPFKTHG